jgi:hypothetical protein
MDKLKNHMGRLSDSIIWSFMVLAALSACAMSNYGRLQSSPDITRAFKAYQVLPDHTYYYRGTFSQPFVMVGINKNYELNSKLWLEVDPQSKDFRTQPWGFNILDHSGNTVGVWYSAIRAAAVEVNEKGQIVNLSPQRVVTRGGQ